MPGSIPGRRTITVAGVKALVTRRWFEQLTADLDDNERAQLRQCVEFYADPPLITIDAARINADLDVLADPRPLPFQVLRGA